MARHYYKEPKPSKGKCIFPDCKKSWEYPRLFCVKHLELPQPRRQELLNAYIQDGSTQSKP